jgi:hypothetical protein
MHSRRRSDQAERPSHPRKCQGRHHGNVARSTFADPHHQPGRKLSNAVRAHPCDAEKRRFYRHLGGICMGRHIASHRPFSKKKREGLASHNPRERVFMAIPKHPCDAENTSNSSPLSASVTWRHMASHRRFCDTCDAASTRHVTSFPPIRGNVDVTVAHGQRKRERARTTLQSPPKQKQAPAKKNWVPPWLTARRPPSRPCRRPSTPIQAPQFFRHPPRHR